MADGSILVITYLRTWKPHYQVPARGCVYFVTQNISGLSLWLCILLQYEIYIPIKSMSTFIWFCCLTLTTGVIIFDHCQVTMSVAPRLSHLICLQQYLKWDCDWVVLSDDSYFSCSTLNIALKILFFSVQGWYYCIVLYKDFHLKLKWWSGLWENQLKCVASQSM